MKLGIPTLCRYDLLDDLLRSAEAGSLHPSGYVIIDNGGGYGRSRLDAVLGPERAPVAELVTPGRNMGVAASWNWMLAEAEAANEPLVISNDDVRFTRSTFADLASELATTAFVEGEGWALFGQRPEVVRRVGYYDENFWPAYYEDVDYDLRLRRAGIVPVRVITEPFQHVGWATTRSQEDARWLAEGRERNHQYFLKKWGAESANPRWNGHPGIQHYPEPFNGSPPPGWNERRRSSPPPMRWDVLNYVARCIRAHRYLEISVGPSETLERVNVPEKWVVNPTLPESQHRAASLIAPVDSDAFIRMTMAERARWDGTFDLVFIDGDHIANLVEREARCALDLLSEGGVLVLHDCNPHTELMQRVPGEGGEWTGDVWKAVARLRSAGYRIEVLASDYGIGILTKPTTLAAALPMPALDYAALTYADLEANRESLLGLTDTWSWEREIDRMLSARAAG